MYEVAHLNLLKSHKETQTVVTIANQPSNTGQLDSFLSTFHEQKVLSNQKVVGINTMENKEKIFRKS